MPVWSALCGVWCHIHNVHRSQLWHRFCHGYTHAHCDARIAYSYTHARSTHRDTRPHSHARAIRSTDTLHQSDNNTGNLWHECPARAIPASVCGK
jgi:hypothetical protein